ncbi:hypothetical protein M1N46_01600 [Dehalococcoidia bacterium]|nr:hypothetical protein [Dehalococcoidia bacterium]
MPTTSNAKKGWILEQLNIEGKRSGEGFVAHKATLVNALSRAVADRVMLNDVTLGRKGLLGYLRALGGSNIVKVTPSNGSASGLQATAKRLKVICGANTSYLDDGAWITEKTPFAFCNVRVSPSNSVKPNVGAIELAEALARVLPFAAKDENKPVLSSVNFEARGGKLRLVGADGYRLAVVTLDYEDGEGQALINRDNLKGIAYALKRAKRVRVSFEAGEEKLTDKSLIIDTELVRYKWVSVDGSYPDYERLIPTEFKATAHFDTVEAVKAVSSLKALPDSKALDAYPIDLTVGNGKLVMANPDDKGQAEIVADTDGEAIKVRIDGRYLAEALRACGGMVDFKLSGPTAPMLFSADGYQLAVMPMQIPPEAKKAEAERAKAETKPTEAVAEQADQSDQGAKAIVEQAEQVAEAVAEQAEQVAEAKPKRKRKDRETVAVA